MKQLNKQQIYNKWILMTTWIDHLGIKHTDLPELVSKLQYNNKIISRITKIKKIKNGIHSR